MSNSSQTASTIPLDQAVPGMVLAAEVRHKNGSVLLKSGITLSESHIASLQQRDVAEIAIVPVQAAGETLSPEKRRELQRALKLEVERMFRRAGTDATTQALMRTVLEYRMEKLG